MNMLKNIFALLGVLLLIYSILGKFMGGPSLGLGIIGVSAQSGILIANAFMLVSILIRDVKK